VRHSAGYEAARVNFSCNNMPKLVLRNKRTQDSKMRHFHAVIRRLCILLPLIALLASGCTTVTTQSFRASNNSSIESSHIAVGADFGKYDRLYATDMGIFFPANAAPSAADQERTRRVFREAFLSELTDYDIVREKGPTALEVQASIIDYRNASGDSLPQMRREIQAMAKPGALLFLMELKDSQTGEVLARAADSASAPAFSTSDSSATDWTTVETAAKRWAGLFHQFLDENLNQ